MLYGKVLIKRVNACMPVKQNVQLVRSIMGFRRVDGAWTKWLLHGKCVKSGKIYFSGL